MLRHFVSHSKITRVLSLMAFLSYVSSAQHDAFLGGGNGLSGGGMGDGTQGLGGSGAGGAMTPMEYVAAVRAINQNYDTQAQDQQAAMIQANNAMAECGLRAMESQNQANQSYDNSGQQSPLGNAVQSALPTLLNSGPAMQEALSTRKEELKKQNERAAEDFNAQVASFCNRPGMSCGSRPRLDSEGQETGSFGGLNSACDQYLTQDSANGNNNQYHMCQNQVNNLRYARNEAIDRITKNKTNMGKASGLIWGIGTSLVTGALSYFATSKANKQQEESNNKYRQASNEQTALAQKICEANAQQAYDLAKNRLAEINKNRKNALADLGMAASIPGVKQSQLGKGDTDVPVDMDLKGTGPMIPVGEAQKFSDPVQPEAALANNATDPAAPSSATGGGGGGGGNNSAPPSTFGSGPGPDRAGLPSSPGVKAGTIAGGSGVIPLNSGNEGLDPFSAFGFPGASEGEANRGPASVGPVPVGDGGLLKLLVMARRRYSAHAPDLVKSVDVNQIAKSISKPDTNRKVSSENSLK